MSFAKAINESETVTPATDKSPLMVTLSAPSRVSISKIPVLPDESKLRAEAVLSIRSQSTAAPVVVKSPVEVTPTPVMRPVLVIAPEPTVPASVTFAPENVAAVVEPDFTIKLLLLLVSAPY